MMCLYIFVYAKIALLRIFTGCFLRQHVSRMCVIIFSHRHYIIDNQAANNRGGGVFSEMVAVETRLCNAGAPSCLE